MERVEVVGETWKTARKNTEVMQDNKHRKLVPTPHSKSDSTCIASDWLTRHDTLVLLKVWVCMDSK